MTRGHRGSLTLQCAASSSATPCRFIPALRPDRVPSPTTSATSRPATVDAVAPARYRIHFDASAEPRDKLERLRALMRGSVPDGDLAAIIDMPVSEKLARLESKRYGRTSQPRKTLAGTDPTPTSRHIPAAARRAVYERDGGRCSYNDRQGRRCGERHELEFHHRFPFGLGADQSPAGITLRCRTHNLLAAEQDHGSARIERHWRASIATRDASSSPG